ncbi:hypothetical protein ACHAWF_017345 [Thalassiosira exigua]
MRAYHLYLLVSRVLCATCTLGIAQGGHKRMLRADPVLEGISNTEIASSAWKPLLLTRENPQSESSEDSPCSSLSSRWLRRQARDVSERDLSNFFNWHVHTLAFAYKLFIDPKDPGQEYFGVRGEYTQEVDYMVERTQQFWSRSGNEEDILILGAHGSDLAELEKLIPTLNVMFSGSYTDDYTVYNHAFHVQELIERLPGGYTNPLLTFNAFATDKTEEAASIIIGDGYFEFQESMGLVSEGPEYALTHEHAHHLQFAMGSQEEYLSSSQNARRQELMADAFSAYFLAHNSGGGMSAEKIYNVHTVAYSLGDCEVTSETHHGTPQERSCASRWGASFAESENAAVDLTELTNSFDIWYGRLDGADEFCEQLHLHSAAGLTSHNVVHHTLNLVVIYVILNLF